jgi:chromodomain-helicase-DNA-binding protein 4
MFQVNYNDGTVEGRDDATWQENLSDYNSDFSAPSGNLFMILQTP